MARTIIVSNYSYDPPKEIGRAWLDGNGHAVLRGFTNDPEGLDHMRTVGIVARGDTFIPPSEGNRFLDQMLIEFSGTYVRATESDG
jgi:hypothetical protein